MLRNDCDASGDLHHIHHAGHGLRLCRVERLDGGTVQRRMGDQRGQHAGQLHILREYSRAVALRLRIHTRCHVLLADVAEGCRILERYVLRHRECRGGRHQRTVRRAALAGRMHHFARLRGQLRCGDVPLLGRRRDQHRTRRGAGLAVLHPGVRNRARTTRALQPADGGVAVLLVIGARAFHRHLAPLGIQLVGDDRRQSGVGALPHFQMFRRDANVAVDIDRDERVRRQRTIGRRVTRRLALRPTSVHRHQQSAANHQAHPHEVAAADRRLGMHEEALHVVALFMVAAL